MVKVQLPMGPLVLKSSAKEVNAESAMGGRCISHAPSPQMKQWNPTFITQSICLRSVTPSVCSCDRVEFVPGVVVHQSLDVTLLLHSDWCNLGVQKKPDLWMVQENAFWADTFLREHLFNEPAWCQPSSNQIVLMPKSRQMACEKWLAEWKRTAGSFHWFGKARCWFRNCVPEKSTNWLRDEDRSPLPLAWDVMGELHLSTGGSSVALFHLFHVLKVQREDPSVTSQIRQSQPDPFP